MKAAIFAVLFTILVVTNAEKRCHTEKDCEPGECCLQHFIKGVCTPHGTKGDPCSEAVFGEKHLFHCPCFAGLRCEGEEKEIFGVKIKVNEICVDRPETEAPPEE